jgi:hypothetical protein
MDPNPGRHAQTPPPETLMNSKIWIAMLTLSLGAFIVTGAACPASECEDGEQRCNGEMVETCASGSWGAAEYCPAGEGCMTMDSGIEHCMGSM